MNRRAFGPMYGEKTRRHQALIRSSRQPPEERDPAGIATVYEVRGPEVETQALPTEAAPGALVPVEEVRRIALEWMNPQHHGGSLTSLHFGLDDAKWLRGVLDEYIASQEDPSWRIVSQETNEDGRNWIVLAHPNHEGPDGHRLIVSDYTGLRVGLIYPCRVCGWNRECEDGECHS